MTAATAYAANPMAGMAQARVRAFRPCPVVVTAWSPISLGTTTDRKHGQPRWTEESE